MMRGMQFVTKDLTHVRKHARLITAVKGKSFLWDFFAMVSGTPPEAISF